MVSLLDLHVRVETAADKQLDLDTPILLATLSRGIVGYRLQLTKTIGGRQTPKRYLVLLDQVVLNGLCPMLAQYLVLRCAAFRRSKPRERQRW